jgi:GntR family transcriptional regulator
MIIIDYKDPRPIYEQIVERFKQLILRSILATDEQMPSVRTLAMELSINPNTIQKAYAELERQGFIYTVKGRGNFVAYSDRLLEGKKEEIRQTLHSICQEAAEIGISKEELLDFIEEGGV